MKYIIKFLAITFAAITAISCASVTSFADKLKTVDGVVYRYSDSGESKGAYTGFANTSKGLRYYKNGVPYSNKHFKTKSGKRYLTDEKGYIVTGWKKIKGAWHWFRENGAEATGYVSVLGVNYQFRKNGEWNYSCEAYDDAEKTISKYFENTFPKIHYGGMVFGDHKLIVMATDVDAVKKEIPTFYPEIEVRQCKLTLEQLEMTWNIIEENSYQFSYAHMTGGVDVLNNQVDVEVYEIHDDLVAFIDSLEYGECVKLCENPPVLDD